MSYSYNFYSYLNCVSMENIKVCLRMRPMIETERQEGNQPSFIIQQNTIEINRKVLRELMSSKKVMQAFSYEFNRCYDDDQHNLTIFQQSVKEIVISSMKGINGAIFMYGQTGSGKTFTMLGSKKAELAKTSTLSLKQFIQQSLQNKQFNDIGILIYSMMEIFKEINKDESQQYELQCSYYEIYNENIYDLLLEQHQFPNPLQIGSRPNKEFFVRNLTQVRVTSLEEVINLVHLGEQNRHYAETILNHQSSRSHTIFKISLTSYDQSDFQKSLQRCTESCINFIDLAGSEKISNYNMMNDDPFLNEESTNRSIKDRLKESQSINKSLFFLTRVIALKTQKVPPSHIPFRNSTLTKLMRSSLTGNFRTLLILCLNPSLKQFDQSHSTLRFGLQSRLIENKIEQNYSYSIPNEKDSQNLIIQLQQKLKSQDEVIKLQYEVIKDLQQNSNFKQIEKQTSQIPTQAQSERISGRTSQQMDYRQACDKIEVLQNKNKQHEANAQAMALRIKDSNDQILEYYKSHKELESLIEALRTQNQKLQLFAQQALKRIEIYENPKFLQTLSTQEVSVVQAQLKKQVACIDEEFKIRQKRKPIQKIEKGSPIKSQRPMMQTTDGSNKRRIPFYQNSSEENLEEISSKELFLDVDYQRSSRSENIESISHQSVVDCRETDSDNNTRLQQTSQSSSDTKNANKTPFSKLRVQVKSPTHSNKGRVKVQTKAAPIPVKTSKQSPPTKPKSPGNKPLAKPQVSDVSLDQAITYIQNMQDAQQLYVQPIPNYRSRSSDSKSKGNSESQIEREKRQLQQDIQSLADKLYGLANRGDNVARTMQPKSLLSQMNKDQIIFETDSELGMESRDSISVQLDEKRVQRRYKTKI